MAKIIHSDCIYMTFRKHKLVSSEGRRGKSFGVSLSISLLTVMCESPLLSCSGRHWPDTSCLKSLIPLVKGFSPTRLLPYFRCQFLSSSLSVTSARQLLQASLLKPLLGLNFLEQLIELDVLLVCYIMEVVEQWGEQTHIQVRVWKGAGCQVYVCCGSGTGIWPYSPMWRFSHPQKSGVVFGLPDCGGPFLFSRRWEGL